METELREQVVEIGTEKDNDPKDKTPYDTRNHIYIWSLYGP